MKKNLYNVLLVSYAIFTILVCLAEPIGPIAPIYRFAYDVFAIGNLINLVRILRKPLNAQSCAHKAAR